MYEQINQPTMTIPAPTPSAISYTIRLREL